MRRRIRLFSLLVLQFLGLSVFLKGFFPLKKAIPGSASFLEVPPEPGSAERGHGVPAVFDRFVFVLIDALRADFVFENTAMTYTRNLIKNNNTLSFIARAHSPTVTMPRVKALMTGGIPGFVDVILNSVSSSLQEDSLPMQIVAAGKKILFFGDDTWMKLFPGHFLRSDGTTSFFVTDYTEVDYNVTRHLDKELQSKDWDIMVLHYLGLDHIGHLAGPSSPLVVPKLQEMDSIIQKIHTGLIKYDREQGTKSLMMLCGDHGMSDSGSHGGATLPETLTALVFFSSHFHNGRGSMFSELMVDQIDVVSTLASVLGLPIPQNSVGHVIPDLLTVHNPRDRLRALQLNAHQLSKVLQANGHKADSIWELEESHRLHKQWLESWKAADQDKNILTIQSDQVMKQYMKALVSMSSKITASLSCYDIHAMVSGIALLVQVFGWLVTMECYHGNNKVSLSGDVIPSLSSLFTICSCFMVAVAVHMSLCSSTLASGSCSSDILCSKQPLSILFSSVLIIVTSLSLSTLINNIHKLPPFVHGMVQQACSIVSCPVKSLVVGGTVLHVFSLLSSSFVEEEHQTWYFLVKTYLIVNFCLSIKRYLKQKYQEMYRGEQQGECNKGSSEKVNGFSALMSENKLARQNRNFTEEKDKERSISKPRSSFVTLLSLLAPLFCMVLVRVSRTWNQTGIKWADQPDIGDWLILPDNQLILSVISMMSLFIILICTFIRSDVIITIIQGVGLFFVYNYRVAIGTLWSPWTTSQPITQGLTEARAAYICSFVLLLMSFIRFSRTLKYKHHISDYHHFVNYKSMLVGAVQSFCAGLVVIVALVTRAHNFFILAVLIVQQWCLDKYLLTSNTNVISWSTYLVYLWFGQVAYFALGNSNSLSTVDIAAGYIGMQGHDNVVAFCLLALSTYCGPLLWLSAVVHLVVRHSTSQKQLYDGIFDVCMTYTLPQSFLLCVYTILVYGQRYHLFVWSVFSPKLLYDTMKTLVMLVSVTVVMVTSIFVGRVGTVELNKSE